MIYTERERAHLTNPTRLARLERISTTILDTSLRVGKGDNLLINYDPAANYLADIMTILACQRGATVQRLDEDPSVLAGYLAKATKEDSATIIDQFVGTSVRATSWATKAVKIVSRDPHRWDRVDPNIYAKYMTEFSNRVWHPIVSRKPWHKMDYPSPADALEIGMPYLDFDDLILQACDLDWEEIGKEQDILIEEILDPGKELEFFAGRQSDGSYKTHLRMSIEGQKFVRETITHNMPGCEVYSSPVRNTITGTLALSYPILLDGRVLPNLFLEFAEGKVVSYKVESSDPKHLEWVTNVLNRHPDTKEIGEVGLGMNRKLKIPIPNNLLVEKVSGFHIALGYAHREADNGVKGPVHQDVTCIMLPEYGGGLILVDGVVIQENGRFVNDSRLAALNPY